MSTDQAAAEANENEPNSGRPMASFSGTGGLNVAVWKYKNDSGYDNYSVRMDRTYKDKDGEFQTTQYLRDGDLLRAQKLLAQADDWIEQDRGRQRGHAGGHAR